MEKIMAAKVDKKQEIRKEYQISHICGNKRIQLLCTDN